MSDYLENLATRTLGLAEMIRPRLPSLFEPPPATNRMGSGRALFDWETELHGPAWEGRVDDPAAAPSSQGGPLGEAVAPPPRRSTEAPTPEPGGVRVHPRPAGMPGPTTRLLAGSEAPSIWKRATRREAVIAPGPPDVGLPTEPRSSFEPAIRGSGELERAAGFSAPTKVVPNASVPRILVEPAANESVATPGPVIRVTIGRIEVRAITPPAPAPRTRPAPPGPALSLEDYLKQRHRKDR